MDYDEYFNSYMSNVISSRSIIRSVMALLERQDDMLRLMYLHWNAQNDEDPQSPVQSPAPSYARAPLRRRTGVGTHSPIYRTAMRNHVQSSGNNRIYTENVINNQRRDSPRNIPVRNIPVRNIPIRNNLNNNNNNTNTTNGNPSNVESSIAELFAQAILNSMGNLGPLSPVIVRPTRRTIELATEDILFSEIPSNIDRYQHCPISHESFQANTPITRIIRCGHYFERESIARWFETSCHCPICRADIRDGIDNNEDSHNEEIVDDDAANSADQDPDQASVNNDNDNNNTEDRDNNNNNLQRNRSITDILSAMSNGMDRENAASISYQFEFVPVVRNVTNGLPPHLTSQFDISHNTSSPGSYRTTYSRSYDFSGNNFS